VRFGSKTHIIEDICGLDDSLDDARVNGSVSILYDVQNTYNLEIGF